MFSSRYEFGNSGRKIHSFVLDGSINGFQSHNHRIEKDSVFIVTLRNVKEAVYEKQIAIKWASAFVSPVLAILYGEAYDLPKKSGAFEVFKSLIDSGAVKAENMMSDIVNNQTHKYYLKKKEFNFFKKQLVDREMLNEAEAYYKIYENSRKKLTSHVLIQVYRHTIGRYFYFT